MMRMSQGLTALAMVAVAQAASLSPAAAQLQRSGIEQSNVPPPTGYGAPTAPQPRRPAQAAPTPYSPTPYEPLPYPPGSNAGAAPARAATAPAPPGGAAPAQAEPDGMVVQPPAVKISNGYAVYAGLDKITGRITSFDVAIGETVQFGALQVTPRVCYTRPANETQNTTSFTEVNEVTLKGEAKRIFTGWMFASSPGLHGVEHPVYDVWLIGCKAPAPVTAAPAGQQ
ncbi:DUF2155 domain-containing protein [Xanthobacter sp. V2C-8]|uniref:DUF2155 domain-containing protein n=1 Tax=Xanthobacter albus TaxID=3119929 RepID=UPI00372BFD41